MPCESSPLKNEGRAPNTEENFRVKPQEIAWSLKTGATTADSANAFSVTIFTE